MAIKGEIDKARFRLREAMVSGEIEGEPYSVTMNVDRKAIFVEMMDKRTMYSVADMVIDTYNELRNSKSYRRKNEG